MSKLIIQYELLYPYEYMNGWECLKEMQLPLIEAFSGVLRPGSLSKIVVLVLNGNASLNSF